MTKVQKIEKIGGLGQIVKCYAPFNKQVKSLKNAEAKYPYVMSVRDVAYMRLNKGSKEGTRTCLAPIHAKNSPIIIAMISPLITNSKMAKQAVEAHRNGQYFVTKDTEIYDKYAKIAETDKNKKPEKRMAIFIPEKGNHLIKPNSKEAKAILGDVQKQYFERFAGNGITFYPINSNFVDKQKGTTVNYLWFRGTGDDSDLDGDDRALYDDDRAFGVLKKTSEAGSRKKLPYTPKEVNNILKIANEVKEGNLPNSKLEKIVSFLERIKQ